MDNNNRHKQYNNDTNHTGTMNIQAIVHTDIESSSKQLCTHVANNQDGNQRRESKIKLR
jgi:hypothetical protein